MIGDLLPAWAVAEYTFSDARGAPASTMFPEEAARVAGAVTKRQQEYATVRVCARAALRRLGYAPVPLLGNGRGAPLWPTGVIGSMTHCDGYRAAVVARGTAAASIGIDAEPNQPLPSGLLGQFALPSERDQLGELAARHPSTHWDRLLFSAKESVFKTWYPLTGRELEFHEAELTINPTDGTFTTRLLVPGPLVGGRRLDTFFGRWGVGNGLVVTAIALPAPASKG